jgi:hypothetical protein
VKKAIVGSADESANLNRLLDDGDWWHKNLAELTEDIVHDLQGRTIYYICIIKYQKDYLRDPSSSAGRYSAGEVVEGEAWREWVI